ncbi:uncharacterized protein [Oncorhynchus clarkii lewisi]|uniref:uncharacterized protein n=1 Tax=Oncorhynchus clarkii lewisi TaxID=490388 RepID=UPI0039B8C533
MGTAGALFSVAPPLPEARVGGTAGALFSVDPPLPEARVGGTAGALFSVDPPLPEARVGGTAGALFSVAPPLLEARVGGTAGALFSVDPPLPEARGLKTITYYKGKPNRELLSDLSLQDELNAFYARFEASSTEPCMRAPAVLNECVITLSIADVNYRPAFNTIVPSKFITKLRSLGLNTSLFNWILDFLTVRPQVVRERSQESDSEDALEKEVSEVEDNTEYDPDQETTDVEQSSDEDEGPAEVVVTFRSKNGNLSWSSSTPERRGQLSTENVIRMTPGPMRYAISRVDDIKFGFELFLTESIETIVINMTNLEGRRIYKDNWKEVIHFDNRETTPGRRQKDKLAAIREVYTGKPADGVPERNQGMRVVLEMTVGLQEHNITCDNLFTSYALGQELLQKKLPWWVRKKNVLLMTTLHRDAAVSTREDKKPNAVLDYNTNKGGVDNLEKVAGTYSCNRLTARWPVVVFFNILDVSAFKAFVVWMEVNPGWKQGKFFKRRFFLEELGKAMVAPLIQRRQRLPRTPSSAGLVSDIQGPEVRSTATRDRRDKRKRCNLYAPRDVKTSIMCHKCSAYICKAHAATTTYCPTCA